jgi:hypothetical protein
VRAWPVLDHFQALLTAKAQEFSKKKQEKVKNGRLFSLFDAKNHNQTASKKIEQYVPPQI